MFLRLRYYGRTDRFFRSDFFYTHIWLNEKLLYHRLIVTFHWSVRLTIPTPSHVFFSPIWGNWIRRIDWWKIRLLVLEISTSKVDFFANRIKCLLYAFYNGLCFRDSSWLFIFPYVFWWVEFNGEKILCLGPSLRGISRASCNFFRIKMTTDDLNILEIG